MNPRIIVALFSLALAAFANAQTVFTLNKASYLPGEAITATWSGRISPKAKDWIGIYPRTVAPGAQNSPLWAYTNGTRTAGTNALAAGSVTFSSPTLAVGQWSAYFLDNDGYSSLGRVDFTIATAVAPVSMSVNKASYTAGEAITVTWSNRTSATANDKIGIFARNASPATATAAATLYTSGTQTPGSPLAAGSVTFNSPGLASGDWTAHFLDSDGTTSRGSVNFSVAAPAPVFTLNKQTYEVNENIVVTWSGRTTPSTTDWVGIYPTSMSGVPDGNPVSTIWAYAGSGTTTAGTAKANGTFTFTAPGLAKGQWTAYFLANDGYQILGQVQFTVSNSPRILGFSADHPFINDGTPITLSWVVDPGDGNINTLVVDDGTTQTNVLGTDVLEVSPQQNTNYRLILNGNINRLASVFNEERNSEQFSIGGNHVSVGSPLTAVWNGAAGNGDSWVAIYRAGDNPDTHQAAYWYYLNGTKTTGGSFPNGTMSFNNLPAGEYYAILFSNGGYVIERGPIRFTVVAGTIAPLAVSSFGNDDGDVRLDWNSLPGVSYDVETSTDLIHWTPEAGAIRARGLSTSVFMPPTPEDIQRFYRVKQN